MASIRRFSLKQSQADETGRIAQPLVLTKLVPSQRLWEVWLFASWTANCVYRFVSYKQNRKPTRPTTQRSKLLMLFPENDFTISLPAQRIGQRKRATWAPRRCYTGERLWDDLGAVLLPAVNPNAINAFWPIPFSPQLLGQYPKIGKVFRFRVNSDVFSRCNKWNRQFRLWWQSSIRKIPRLARGR